MRVVVLFVCDIVAIAGFCGGFKLHDSRNRERDRERYVFSIYAFIFDRIVVARRVDMIVIFSINCLCAAMSFRLQKITTFQNV